MKKYIFIVSQYICIFYILNIFNVVNAETPVTKDSTVIRKYGELLGNKPLHILMCAYSDSPKFTEIKGEFGTVISPEYIKKIFNGDKKSVDFYWKTISQNKLTINDSKVFGWYRLHYNKAYYGNDGTEFIKFQIHCMNAATKDGFGKTKPHSVVFIKADNEAREKGITAFHQFTSLPAQYPDGCYGYKRDTVKNECSAEPTDGESEYREKNTSSVIFMSSKASDFWGGRAYLAHEMGHSFNLPHSKFYDFFEHKPGMNVDYKNVFDLMSFQHALAYNPEKFLPFLPQNLIGYHRYRLGWYDTNQVVNYQLGSKDLTVKLDTASLPSKNQYKLLLLKFNNKSMVYSIEVRGVKDRSTLDAYFDDKLDASVVIIHQHTLNNDSPFSGGMNHTLINPGKIKYPDSVGSYNESVMMRAGDSWISPVRSDDKKRFKLTVKSVGNRDATIHITSID
jgi:M6 family metalloprotease-like protein